MEYPRREPERKQNGTMRQGPRKKLEEWSAAARDYLSQLSGVKRVSGPGMMPEEFSCGCSIKAMGGTICDRHVTALDAGD